VNPYAHHLGDRNPREIISETAQRLTTLAARIGSGLSNRPAPDKWSASEILCHLADCEIVFSFRLKQSIAEPYHVIQPFDQDAWARRYAALDGNVALETFRVVRRWNVEFIAAMTAEDLAKKLKHPERGEMTVQTVIETMGGHDLNHLAQLERIAGM
jgi:hypothetical protein